MHAPMPALRSEATDDEDAMTKRTRFLRESGAISRILEGLENASGADDASPLLSSLVEATAYGEGCEAFLAVAPPSKRVTGILYKQSLVSDDGCLAKMCRVARNLIAASKTMTRRCVDAEGRVKTVCFDFLSSSMCLDYDDVPGEMMSLLAEVVGAWPEDAAVHMGPIAYVTRFADEAAPSSRVVKEWLLAKFHDLWSGDCADLTVDDDAGEDMQWVLDDAAKRGALRGDVVARMLASGSVYTRLVAARLCNLTDPVATEEAVLVHLLGLATTAVFVWDDDAIDRITLARTAKDALRRHEAEMARRLMDGEVGGLVDAFADAMRASRAVDNERAFTLTSRKGPPSPPRQKWMFNTPGYGNMPVKIGGEVLHVNPAVSGSRFLDEALRFQQEEFGGSDTRGRLLELSHPTAMTGAEAHRAVVGCLSCVWFGEMAASYDDPGCVGKLCDMIRCADWLEMDPVHEFLERALRRLAGLVTAAEAEKLLDAVCAARLSEEHYRYEKAMYFVAARVKARPGAAEAGLGDHYVAVRPCSDALRMLVNDVVERSGWRAMLHGGASER